MPYQCGTGSEAFADNIAVESIDVEDFDIVVAYSDGFSDNVYSENMASCLNHWLDHGIITSLSRAADCLARKAHYLSKNSSYVSPFNAAWKEAFENGEDLPNPPPPGYSFIGGKQDDITVTVAQVFITDPQKRKEDDPLRKLAQDDPYFKDQKTVYRTRLEDLGFPVSQSDPPKPTNGMKQISP